QPGLRGHAVSEAQNQGHCPQCLPVPHVKSPLNRFVAERIGTATACFFGRKRKFRDAIQKEEGKSSAWRSRTYAPNTRTQAARRPSESAYPRAILKSAPFGTCPLAGHNPTIVM